MNFKKHSIQQACISASNRSKILNLKKNIMKRISLIIVIVIAVSMKLQAQNVGINVPFPTAELHVDSSIRIGKDNSLNSGTPGRKNLLKFGDGNYTTIGEEIIDDKLYIRYGDLILMKSNTPSGSGFIGIGTETPSANLDLIGTMRLRNGAAAGKILTSDANGNATWQTGTGGGGLTLPFTASDGSAGSSFIVSNTNGAANGISGQAYGTGNGVQGFTSGGKGIYGSANAGTGVDAYSNTGTAGVFTSNNGLAIKTVTGNVEINGKLKMIDGTQAAGRVLTADANGLASWQNLPAAPASVDIYGSRMTANLTVSSSGVGTIITGWTNIGQSGGNNYNFATGVYTIPVTGFYQVNGTILWDAIPTNCQLSLVLNYNSGTTISQSAHPSNNQFGTTCNISLGRRFNAGDKISFTARQSSGNDVSLYRDYDGQNFSIALIHP